MKSSAKFALRSKTVWGLGTGLIALLWSYWPGFIEMSGRWERDPEYSHGYLVPLIALAVLWFRYDLLQMGQPRYARAGIAMLVSGISLLLLSSEQINHHWGFLFAGVALVGTGWLLAPEKFDASKFPPSWWGLPLLGFGLILRYIAALYYMEWFDHLSLISCIAGIVLLTVGHLGFRWSWPSILFLGFMIPLPHTLEVMLREPLRKIGTLASTFLMQTIGLPAFADGHRHEVLVGGMTHRIGVNEACSGLSMLMVFLALSTAFALIINRPVWDKAIIFLSAIPIALISNIVRITTTGIMLYTLENETVYLGIGNFVLINMDGTEFANTFFHDWAGFMMPPFALGLLWIELSILKRLVIVEEDVPLSVGLSPSGNKHNSADSSKNTPTPSSDSSSPAIKEVNHTSSATT